MPMYSRDCCAKYALSHDFGEEEMLASTGCTLRPSCPGNDKTIVAVQQQTSTDASSINKMFIIYRNAIKSKRRWRTTGIAQYIGQ